MRDQRTAEKKKSLIIDSNPAFPVYVATSYLAKKKKKKKNKHPRASRLSVPALTPEQPANLEYVLTTKPPTSNPRSELESGSTLHLALAAAALSSRITAQTINYDPAAVVRKPEFISHSHLHVGRYVCV